MQSALNEHDTATLNERIRIAAQWTGHLAIAQNSATSVASLYK